MDDFSTYTVTCTTAGCGNGGIPIDVQAPSENPNFICGVCMQPITSIEKHTA